MKQNENQCEIGNGVSHFGVLEMPEVQHIAAEQDAAAQRHENRRHAPAVEPNRRQNDRNQN